MLLLVLLALMLLLLLSRLLVLLSRLLPSPSPLALGGESTATMQTALRG
jgi:hypothetical protein